MNTSDPFPLFHTNSSFLPDTEKGEKCDELPSSTHCSEWIKKHRMEKVTPPFPSLGERGDKLGFYSANGFRLTKSKIERISGVEFKIKDFRSTLTSITVNGDLSRLPAMSAQLRHASVATTQKSYFAMENGLAGKQLRDAWKVHPIASSIKHEKAVIEPYRNLPGYGWWWVCPNSPFIDSLD